VSRGPFGDTFRGGEPWLVVRSGVAVGTERKDGAAAPDRVCQRPGGEQPAAPAHASVS
jgi:hypothetical protein